MPKPMYVWSGSAWVSVATEVESLATYATQSYADNQPGSKLIVPSSISVGSGSGSVATQGTISFSGATSVSLNNVFSSTYKNYIAQLNFNSPTPVDIAFTLRLRASGSDQTTAVYDVNTINPTNTNTTAQTSFIMTQGNRTKHLHEVTFFSPQENTDTRIMSHYHIFDAAGANLSQGITAGSYRNSYQADGFTALFSTVATGTISVYGYKAG